MSAIGVCFALALYVGNLVWAVLRPRDMFPEYHLSDAELGLSSRAYEAALQVANETPVHSRVSLVLVAMFSAGVEFAAFMSPPPMVWVVHLLMVPLSLLSLFPVWRWLILAVGLSTLQIEEAHDE